MTAPSIPSSPQRILIIKPSALGDVVHTLPVLNLLRAHWPNAQISWLVSSSFASLLRGHPQLDEVVEFDRNLFSSWWWNPRATMKLLRFMRRVRNARYDLVIDLQGLQRSAWLTLLTRAPVRVGFANAREWAHLAYTHPVPIHTMQQHAVDRYLTITEYLGCGRSPANFQFAIDDNDRAQIQSMVENVGRFAVLMPGTNWVTKRWPIERFAELVAPLMQSHGLSCVVAGGNDVLPLAAQIPGALNLAGKTNLRQLVALFDRAELVIANDSGPMHIAAALGKPLVTIYGPTNPVRTGPYGRTDSVVRLDIPCSPCYSRRCSHLSCMNWLSVQNVMDEVERQLVKKAALLPIL